MFIKFFDLNVVLFSTMALQQLVAVKHFFGSNLILAMLVVKAKSPKIYVRQYLIFNSYVCKAQSRIRQKGELVI